MIGIQADLCLRKKDNSMCRKCRNPWLDKQISLENVCQNEINGAVPMYRSGGSGPIIIMWFYLEGYNFLSSVLSWIGNGVFRAWVVTPNVHKFLIG